MAKAETVKLLTNIPLTLSALKYADYSQSEKAKAEGWAPQVKLTGTMDGRDVSVFLPGGCLNDLCAQGIVDDTGNTTKWGTPEYKVLNTGPITILRTEEGTKKYTSINPDLGAKMTAPGATGQASAPQNAGKPPQQAPSAPKPQPTGQVSDLEGWAVLEATYRACADIAVRTWEGRTINGEPIGISDIGIFAATATVMIDAQKKGLKAFPPKPEPGPLDKMPSALSPNPDADDDLGF